MTESVTPIRVGVVGAGANTKTKHIPLLKRIPGVSLVGVVNRRAASTEAAAREFGFRKTYSSWEALVDDPEIDAVVIGTWPYLHCPITLRALEAGKHVLTEARMAMNAREAHAMLDASRQHPELVTQIVPSPMTLEVDNTIRDLLEENAIGTLLTIQCQHSGGYYDPEAPLHWRQDIRLSGLNVMTMGIYYEAIMRWVGPASRVIALGKIYTKSRRSHSGEIHAIEIPEHLDVLADLGEGIQLHLQESAVTPSPKHDGIRLIGTDGWLEYSRGDLHMATRARPEPEPVVIPEARKQFWRVEEEFIQAIRGEAPVRLTQFEDGVRYMEFTEAVHRSLVEGRAVSLPLSPINTPSANRD